MNFRNIFFLALILFIISNPLAAQYNRKATVSTLTNDGSRDWQLDSIIKTFGKCFDQTLVITFNKNYTAVFRFCDKGKMIEKKVRWRLEETGINNLWSLVFFEEIRFERNDDIIVFDSCRIKLESNKRNKKGVKFIMTVQIRKGKKVQFEQKFFHSKN